MTSLAMLATALASAAPPAQRLPGAEIVLPLRLQDQVGLADDAGDGAVAGDDRQRADVSLDEQASHFLERSACGVTVTMSVVITSATMWFLIGRSLPDVCARQAPGWGAGRRGLAGAGGAQPAGWGQAVVVRRMMDAS